MGSKSIQDVAPPKTTARTVAVPAPSSGPELVGNIPVHAPSTQATLPETSATSFDIPEEKKPTTQTLAPAPTKNNAAGQDKPFKSKPTAAILFASLALICLVIGAYLSFLAEG